MSCSHLKSTQRSRLTIGAAWKSFQVEGLSRFDVNFSVVDAFVRGKEAFGLHFSRSYKVVLESLLVAAFSVLDMLLFYSFFRAF